MSVACKIFDPQEPDWGGQARIVNPQRLILKEELRMKKVLSLVLAFAMILGSFGFVFATQFPDVSDTEVYSEAVNVLSGLGVIGGYPDGNFKPANVVTRAEMATMIVNCLGIPVSGGSATKFSDVPSSHWASGYIAYAVSVGFVAGYPDGTFKPEQQVTANEALTMIIASLGYTLDSLNGEYPGAFVNKAKGLGILDTCKKTGTVGAERSDIACYLYDALDAELGVVNRDGEFVSNYEQSGYSKEDNYLVRLGATLYDGGNGKGEPFVVDEAALDNSVVNLVNYLGAYITAYQNKDEEIVAIKEVLSQFIEDDLDTLQKDYKGVEVAAQDAAEYISFTNGAEDAPAKDIDAPSGTIKLAVKLTGTKTVKTIYSMQVWEAEKPFRAEKGIQDEIIDDQAIGGFDFPLDEDDEIDTNAFSIVGRNTITDIAEDDIVTVYLKDGKIVKIEVGTDVVTGKVSKITTGGKYTVGDKTFKKHADATDTAEVDDEGTFYLTYDGKWFAFDPADDSTTNYAVLLATGKDTGRYGSDNYYADLFLADGTEKEFAVKSASVLSDASLSAPNAYGILVKYSVNSSDKIVGLEKATVKGAASFDKNGLSGGIALKSDAACFEFTGGDVDDPANYKVLSASALYDGDVTALSEIDKDKVFKAVLVEGVSGATESFAVFVSDDAKVADGEVWTALYEGAVKELTLDEGLTPTASDVTSGGAVKFYTLTQGADGIVTAVTAKSAAATTAVDISAATSVSGNVFTDGAKNNYSLDKDVAVYIYDESDEEWTAKSASALAGRKNAFTSITLYKTSATGDYDIAIVVKP